MDFAENLWTLTLASVTGLVWAGCLDVALENHTLTHRLHTALCSLSPSRRSACARYSACWFASRYSEIGSAASDSACPGQRATTRFESMHHPGKALRETQPAHRIRCRWPPLSLSLCSALSQPVPRSLRPHRLLLSHGNPWCGNVPCGLPHSAAEPCLAEYHIPLWVWVRMLPWLSHGLLLLGLAVVGCV